MKEKPKCYHCKNNDAQCYFSGMFFCYFCLEIVNKKRDEALQKIMSD